MKKISLVLLFALVFALWMNMANVEASPASLVGPDNNVQRVGLVVAYTAGQSITIAGRDGAQTTFTLAPDLKILPPERANTLGVGSYVTIIAPNNVPGGKGIAVGIVIHPQAPASFPLPTATFTPLPTNTAVPTETAIATEVASETPTEAVVATETSTGAVTETPTGVETATETPTGEMTPTATSIVASGSRTNPQNTLNSFIEWLASLFRQFLASGT